MSRYIIILYSPIHIDFYLLHSKIHYHFQINRQYKIHIFQNKYFINQILLINLEQFIQILQYYLY
jgi:hypothetical protein